MANLYKPVIFQQPAFDATENFTITFSYSGTSVFKNTLLIKKNDTNEEIYRETIESRQLKHTIPANTLINGEVYNVAVQIIDGDNNTSQFSNSVLLYCFTKPVFRITNITENQVLTDSNINVILEYSQEQNEPLNAYNITLYNSNKIEINNSGLIYNNTSLTYNFRNLTDKTFYYVRATGRTLYNTILDTGYILFSVQYSNPSIFTFLELENQANIGAIRITPNLILIEGTVTGNEKYTDAGEIDLTTKNDSVIFDKGFNIDDNFTIKLIGRNFTELEEIINLSNEKYNISVIYRKGTFDNIGEKMYFELKSYNPITYYYLMSNYIDEPNPDTNIYIWIRKQNNIYEIKTEIIT